MLIFFIDFEGVVRKQCNNIIVSTLENYKTVWKQMFKHLCTVQKLLENINILKFMVLEIRSRQYIKYQ